jgi:peroxiredoxin
MRPLLLLLILATCARAQSPLELLRLAQDTYKSPEGYQITGKGSVQPPDSSWQITFNVTIVAPPSPLGEPQAAVQPSGRVGGPYQYVNVSGGTDEKPTSFGIPFSVAQFWDKEAENVDTVTETGKETLPLNGAPTDCRVLQVLYKAPSDGPKPSPVTYSICSDRHLVLKRVVFLPAGRHGTGPEVPWTLTFDTARFNRPAPQWLIDMKNMRARTRKEWLKRPAPDFKLPDLNGNIVALSSLRGKVVLLDFWSIACGPCVREMPMIEAASETHKGDLAVWGVSWDQADRDKKWLQQHQHSLPTLSDTDYVVSDLYKVQGIPALVLIGRDGRIRNYWQGAVAQADLESAIKRAARH